MKAGKKEVKTGYSGEPVNANTWFYFFFAGDRSWPDTILHTVGGFQLTILLYSGTGKAAGSGTTRMFKKGREWRIVPGIQ